MAGAVAAASIIQRRNNRREKSQSKSKHMGYQSVQPRIYTDIFQIIELTNSVGILRNFIAKYPESINLRRYNGKTPLICSIEWNDDQMANLLIEKGADINAKTKRGYSAIDYAIVNKNEKMFDILLEKGVKVTIDEVIIRRSLASKNINMISKVFEQVDLSKERNVQELIKYSIAEDSLLGLEYLSKKGFNMEFLDKEGNLPIHYAAKQGCPKVIRFLAENTKDLNLKNSYGNTPLHIALKSKNLGAVKVFLAKNVDVSMEDREGNNAQALAKINLKKLQKGRYKELVKSIQNDIKMNLNKIKKERKKSMQSMGCFGLCKKSADKAVVRSL